MILASAICTTPRARAISAVLVVAALLPSSKPARAEPDEVVVHGRTTEPGQTTLSNEEVRKVPGAFGDAFRVVDALPGATPFESGIPYSVLRGAPPGNSTVMIDGVAVPLLYHLGIGPAVVHPELIDRVDYFAGGAPAAFGRGVGGVVSAQTREPAPTARGHAHVRAFDAGALVESPFAGDRAHALVAGRYSYTAAALSLLSPGVEIGYWDYQGRASIELDDYDTLSVLAFGSHDKRSELGDFHTTFSADFHRVDVRFDRKLEAGGRVRLAVTLGDDRSTNEQGSTHGRLGRVRMELDRPISSSLRLRAGADASLQHVDAGVPKNALYTVPFATLFPEHDDVSTGIWADVVWRPSRHVEVVPGARVDLYDWHVLGIPPPAQRRDYLYDPPAPATSVPAVDPRLALRFTLRRGLAVVSTIGLHHQGPGFFVPVPGLQPAGFQRGLQSSLQQSAGVEVLLPADILATATVFSHDYKNVTSFSRCSIPQGGFDLTSPCIGNRTDGEAHGLEVLVKRALTHWLGGWVAYTLSRTVEQSATPMTAPQPTGFDHTHVLNVVGSVDFGQGWSAGARLFYYSGRPITQTERSRDFARLDLRLEKRWPFLRTGSIAVVLEGLNVTFAQEDGLTCTNGTCHDEYGPPVVLPSIGVEASW